MGGLKSMVKMRGAMKKMYAEMSHMMYCIYLYGHNDGKQNDEPMSLKKFAKDSKKIHLDGKQMWKENMKKETENV